MPHVAKGRFQCSASSPQLSGRMQCPTRSGSVRSAPASEGIAHGPSGTESGHEQEIVDPGAWTEAVGLVASYRCRRGVSSPHSKRDLEVADLTYMADLTIAEMDGETERRQRGHSEDTATSTPVARMWPLAWQRQSPVWETRDGRGYIEAATRRVS